MDIGYLNKKDNKNFIFLLALVILIFGILYISTYASFVTVRHKETEFKEKIKILTEQQNELKSQFFEINNPKNFETVAQENNLVYNNKPEYLIIKKWVSEEKKL